MRNMKRSVIKIIILLIVIPMIYMGIILLQNLLLKRSFENNYIPLSADYIINSKLHRCNFDIINPKFARVTEFQDRSEKRIGLYEVRNFFSQTKDEWRASRVGGVTVRNTTFKNLLKMTKEDCYQFQRPFGNFQDETINWSYSREKSEEEKEIENQEYTNRRIQNILIDIKRLNSFDPEHKEYIKELYGDWEGLNNEELIEWDDASAKKALTLSDNQLEKLRMLSEKSKQAAQQ